ncbi:MAG: pilus assembly protein, partial [Actinobacteria bacterium]|nr:pilus assembly protein [Actinomycetota bacterium]
MSVLRKSMNNEAGTAVVEFIFIGVLLLVPILYATLMVMRIEAAAMASTHAVREAARAFMMADTRTQGLQQARLASAAAMSDQG